ncbi:MAG: 3,4-dihydroxy-2-butanone-4-phosphate synthase [Dehalococcoidia bacterium]|nr:3,4-dihydroxy-2-butanone-4-phosphate synthase [Dehalococcoidia bacterium]
MTARVEDAIKELQAGRFVVILDDPDRENEGDLAISAEKVTARELLFLIKAAAGFLCISLSASRLDELQIPLMPRTFQDSDTPFCETLDYKCDSSASGSSVHDRARTIRALLDPQSKPQDFARPGHIVPLRARRSGLLERRGHTEAIVDLCGAAGLYPAGLLCEILDEDGHVARGRVLEAFAHTYGFPIVSVWDVVEHLKRSREAVQQAVVSKRSYR